MAHLAAKDLTFTYPESTVPSLDGVDLEVQRGEYVVVMGRSGCGKTTLLRHFKTALTPHGRRSGQVLLEGKPLSGYDPAEQSSRIGYVMQDPDSQLVTDKVWHELAFGLESLGCDQRTMRIRVAEMAGYFGIQSWFHRNVAELSGGQKQLLNLASVMAMQPEVLILDEPTSQLDPIAAGDFLSTVSRINRELGVTVILSEHRLEEVLPRADRVVAMERGRIAVQDTPGRAGDWMHRTHSELLPALPAPMRVYYALGGGAQSPLTVREGRDMLDRICPAPRVTALPEEMPPAEVKEPALEMKDVWFRYEKDAPDVLKGVDIKVPAGRLYALVGGNGTGKSTLLKAMCGAVSPYRGTVKVLGKALKRYRGDELFRGGVAMLPQDPASLFVKKTVGEELAEMGATAAEQAEVAALCAVDHLLKRHPYDLSGGEQQRAALAKVLLRKPRVLLLDEPTKGIDAFFKAKLAQVLKELTRSGTAVVMVSHDVEFCAAYADSVTMFFDGSAFAQNTPRRFFGQNSFYTTAANRMSRHLFENAVTAEDAVQLCRLNGAAAEGGCSP